MDDEWTEGSLSLIDDLKQAANEDFLSFACRAFQQNKTLQNAFQHSEEGIAGTSSWNAIRGGSSNETSLAHSDSSGDPDVEVVDNTELVVTPMLPPKAALYRPPLEVGKVYIVKHVNSRRNSWSKALLLSIIYNVRQGVTNNRCLVKYSDGLVSRRHVEASEIAYLEECPTLISLGTAVVTNIVSSKNALYHAGVVLELPNAMNMFRYLVFLEKGTVCYTQHNELRVIADVYHRITSTVDRYYVRDCLSLYPDRFSLRFKVGEKVDVKRKSEWMEGTVQRIDCSIVQLRFSDGSSEWYPRGSYKFKQVLYGQPNTSHPLKYLQRLQRYREKIAPDITEEHEEGHSNVQTQLVPARSLTTHRVPSLPSQVTSYPLTVITPLLVWWPRDLGNHSCDENCVAGEQIIQRIDHKYGPLVRPLCAGFKRLSQGGSISYKTPCGQIIQNYSQLRRFLECTKVSLNYEHFDFSPRINAQRIYEPNPNSILASLNDISNGLEKCSIPCVNEVNNQLPERITYMTERKFLSYSDELMNNDGNFLSCCSCQDDCKDPAKCECIQLTINSYLEVKEVDNPLAPSEITYQYKRLYNEVRSGIYECNQRCKCSSSCPNRLVQFPLSAKLQLFQTGKKGWGVRALHDLPKGSFVCTYVGVLLNEREANEWGILHGDEYLSDLDFIEKQEASKPGYEEHVEELKDSTTDSKSGVVNTTINKVVVGSHAAGSDHGPPKRRSSRAHSQPPFEIKKRRHSNKKIAVREFPKGSIKRLYPADFSEFTIDAKNGGNIGRYFNHACEPNMFVQNVFVDTHDLRLPWVAFFTLSDVPAGTELTWDYGYSVGSVVGKRLYCYCLANECKRRLY
uniref:Histone-lysine N-methyltransferase eggless n=1 Tax=Lygus hesperus TaxID=30085 RepID=A0A146LMZ4_LYGHE